MYSLATAPCLGNMIGEDLYHNQRSSPGDNQPSGLRERNIYINTISDGSDANLTHLMERCSTIHRLSRTTIVFVLLCIATAISIIACSWNNHIHSESIPRVPMNVIDEDNSHIHGSRRRLKSCCDGDEKKKEPPVAPQERSVRFQEPPDTKRVRVHSAPIKRDFKYQRKRPPPIKTNFANIETVSHIGESKSLLVDTKEHLKSPYELLCDCSVCKKSGYFPPPPSDNDIQEG